VACTRLELWRGGHQHSGIDVVRREAHTEIDSPATGQRSGYVGNVEQITDEDVGARCSQRLGAVIVGSDERSDRPPALEQKVDESGSDGTHLTSCPGDENRSSVG
jgi:hypothetical protein